MTENTPALQAHFTVEELPDEKDTMEMTSSFEAAAGIPPHVTLSFLYSCKDKIDLAIQSYIGFLHGANDETPH